MGHRLDSSMSRREEAGIIPEDSKRTNLEVAPAPKMKVGVGIRYFNNIIFLDCASIVPLDVTAENR